MRKWVSLAVFVGCLSLAVAVSAQSKTATPTLQWLAPTTGGQPKSYRVERCTVSSTTTCLDAAATWATACTIAAPTLKCTEATPQAVGATYLYRCIAVNDFGDGPPSQTATFAALPPGQVGTFSVLSFVVSP